MQIFLVGSILFGLARATIITNDTSTLKNSYEYIIVGGGTTALAVANRLSVNHTVLVIERGPDAMEVEAVNDPFTPFGTCVQFLLTANNLLIQFQPIALLFHDECSTSSWIQQYALTTFDTVRPLRWFRSSSFLLTYLIVEAASAAARRSMP
jgi:choline dehydrogenase-like flavoprotein